MDHDLKTYLDSLQTQLSSIEQRMTTKTDLDAVGRRMAADLVSAVERLDESIKGREEDENALYRSRKTTNSVSSALSKKRFDLPRPT